MSKETLETNHASQVAIPPRFLSALSLRFTFFAQYYEVHNTYILTTY